MASVTINSHTYTDDANPTTGLGGGGHRARFIPLISDVVTVLGTVAANGNLTINRVLVSDASGKVAASSVTSTELDYLSGVTSAVQTQLNNKCPLNNMVSIDDGHSKTTPYATSRAFVRLVTSQADGSNPLEADFEMMRGESATDRYLSILSVEQGVSYRPISLFGSAVWVGSSLDDASGARLQVNGTVNLASGSAYKINNQQIIGARQAAIASAKVDYATGNLDTEAEIITALNTTNGKINSILSVMRWHGLIGG